MSGNQTIQYFGLGSIVAACTGLAIWSVYKNARRRSLCASRATARQTPPAPPHDREHVHEHEGSSSGFVHRGIRCSLCEMTPIIGTRYRCVNCANFDLCESCEVVSLDTHDRTHLFLKIKIPLPPLMITKALLPVYYPGQDAYAELNLNTGEIKLLQNLTHFDRIEIEDLFQQFKNIASGGIITKETFRKCIGTLGVTPNLVTDRLFAFFDQDGNGAIDFPELVCGLSVLCKGGAEEKIDYAFKGYDVDGDGFISRAELYNMFKAYFYLSQEAVRDALRGAEKEYLKNWDEESADPISKAFASVQTNYSNQPSPEDDPHATRKAVLERLDQSLEIQPDRAHMLETVYHQAIDHMVKQVLLHADKDNDGRISSYEFRSWALQDSTMLLWLDALGSVF